MGGMTATVPTSGLYVADSPFTLRRSGDGWEVARDGEKVAQVETAGEPSFYSMRTSDGTPMAKVALRHGRDAVGSTVLQSCSYGRSACVFCAIAQSATSGSTVGRKSPAQMAEVALAAEREGYSHFVLTTGRGAGQDHGALELARCAEAVKACSSLEVHVQYEPPDDPAVTGELGRVADTAAINIESFDERVRARATPGKAQTSLETYVEAWKDAVDAFGPGQVTSFVIAGLGETAESVVEGCRLLSSLGVYPFLLPLRPLAGTPVESRMPPAAGEMMRLYEACAAVVAATGLRAVDAKAGCVRCGACGAFTDFTG